MKRLFQDSLKILRRKNVKYKMSQVPEPTNSIKIIMEECFNNRKMTTKLDQLKHIKKFKRLIWLRSLHFPVQYLCKVWPFRDLNLRLRKPILIPRFQSQFMITLLIDKIRQKYQKCQISGLQFVEYGCGSGALGLSLIKQLNLNGTLIDIKPECTKMTKINAFTNGISTQNLNIIEGDMKDYTSLITQVDIVVSNPPYLSQEHYKTKLKRQIKMFEDRQALVADQNGLKYVRLLGDAWKNRTKPGLFMVQFDGRILDGDLSWMEPFVVADQYDRRRFILMQK